MNAPVTVWRYSLPPEADRISGWAIVLMDASGMFAAVSDYGNYAYKWSSFGHDDFRRFVIGLEADYTRRKLSPGQSYDAELTLRAVKGEIMRLRLRGGREGVPDPESMDGRTLGRPLNRDEAREEWERLKNHSDLWTREDYAVWAQDTRLDYFELSRTKPDVRAVSFCERILPRLQAILRDELAKEAA